ncbi:MAG: LysR family transcriptional regulator [Oscillospiraceae bacterium]|nr:LysR family transcriptional regulator [Oscillospiraceae bacterium]
MYQRVRYFLKAAETGSFSLAAQALYVSPQALTKQIGVLETEVGGRLFVRTRRGVTLTPFGRCAREKLERALREFDAALRDLRDYAADRNQISIGIFSALPRESLVLPMVSYLLAAFPAYQITLEMLELSEGLRKFLDGKLDFLLTNTHEQDDWAGYEKLSFGSYDARVVVSLVHPWAIRESVSREDLAGESFIKMRMDDDHYTVPHEISFYNNIPCRRVIEANNFETMMVLLGQGAGFAVFPLAFTSMDAARIKSFDYPGAPLRFTTALLYDPRRDDEGRRSIVRGLREQFVPEETVTTEGWTRDTKN